MIKVFNLQNNTDNVCENIVVTPEIIHTIIIYSTEVAINEPYGTSITSVSDKIR